MSVGSPAVLGRLVYAARVVQESAPLSKVFAETLKNHPDLPASAKLEILSELYRLDPAQAFTSASQELNHNLSVSHSVDLANLISIQKLTPELKTFLRSHLAHPNIWVASTFLSNLSSDASFSESDILKFLERIEPQSDFDGPTPSIRLAFLRLEYRNPAVAKKLKDVLSKMLLSKGTSPTSKRAILDLFESRLQNPILEGDSADARTRLTEFVEKAPNDPEAKSLRRRIEIGACAFDKVVPK